jgi:secreted trypsin-like serine protease
MTDAQLKTVVARAIRKAEKAAPDDDKAFLESLLAATRQPDTNRGRALSLNAGRSSPPGRLDQDPRYLESLRALARQTLSNARIIGGSAVRGTEFDDCVAVGDDDRWGCTGTLIAPDVVLTAAHCQALHTRVFIGNDVEKRGRVFRVQKHIRHSAFDDRYRNDLMLLFLEGTVTGVKPRPLAPTSLIDAATAGRIVGFGTTDLAGTSGFGIKRQIDVPIVSASCSGQAQGKTDPVLYGCHADAEIVAGKPLLLRDSCKGDSGGPLFIADARNRWLLAGTTSRGTDLATTMCGDGGLYVRTDRYRDWIRSTLATR